MKEKAETDVNGSTEEKIKEAARRVFTRKGYAATRTRDIAEESGYNVALINYYFRSKEKLFDIICLENIQLFLPSVLDIINDRATTLQEKIEIMVGKYIDMLLKHPDIPFFVLSEIQADPEKLVQKILANNTDVVLPRDTYIAKQWRAYMEAAKGDKVNPLHIFINTMSMVIFPFVASPLLRNRTGISVEQFNVLMEERKKLIPVWVKAMMG